MPRFQSSIVVTAVVVNVLLSHVFFTCLHNVAVVNAFNGLSLRRRPSIRKTSFVSSSTLLKMSPRYDPITEKWSPTSPQEEEAAGYGPLGTLLRAGPKPFLQRIFSREQYDQAVLKYMALDQCSRDEAQGNMDAYFENPMDWTYQKIEEQRGRPKRNYATANTDPKQIVLTSTWAAIVLVFLNTFIMDCIAGKYPLKKLF